MPKIIHINKWDRYWKLTIIKEVKPKISPNWKIIKQFLFKCDCWKEKILILNNVRRWLTQSCWCSYKTHWMHWTRIYRIWNGLKNRCDNNIKRYSQITYDKKWEKFEWFYEDMKEWYKDNLTIDRIDNTKWYSKENCRWATHIEQARNRNNNLLYKWITIAEWCEKLNIKRKVFDNRYHKGKTIEQSLWF